MMKLGVASVLALTSLTGTSAQCGRTVLANDFDQYSGAYQLWTEAEAARDFASSGKRPGFDDKPVETGLVFDATTAFSRLSTLPTLPACIDMSSGVVKWLTQEQRYLCSQFGVSTWGVRWPANTQKRMWFHARLGCPVAPVKNLCIRR